MLTANSYSKSLLRTVAGQLAQEHRDVDYFPSYELITGEPFEAWLQKAGAGDDPLAGLPESARAG